MYVHRLSESPNRSLHGMIRWHLKEYFLLQTIKQQVHGLRLPIRKHLSRRLSSVRTNNLVIFLYFGSPFLLLPTVSWTCLLCLQKKKANKNVKGNKGKDSLANDKINDNKTKAKLWLQQNEKRNAAHARHEPIRKRKLKSTFVPSAS